MAIVSLLGAVCEEASTEATACAHYMGRVMW